MSIQASTILFTFVLILVSIGLIYTLVGESANSKPNRLLLIAGAPLLIFVTAYTYRVQIQNSFPKDVGLAVAASLEIAMLVISVVCGAVFSLAVTNRGALKRTKRISQLQAQLAQCKALQDKADEDIKSMLEDPARVFNKDAFMAWHANRKKVCMEYDQKEQELLRRIEELN